MSIASDHKLTEDEYSLVEELVRLEGAADIFDSVIKGAVAARRREVVKKALRQSGETPSKMAKDVEIIDSALEKIEANVRMQYADFFSAFVSERARAFTAEERRAFLAVLRKQDVQDYLCASRRVGEELSKVMNVVLQKMMKRAVSVVEVDKGATNLS